MSTESNVSLRAYLEDVLLEREVSPTHAESLRRRIDKFSLFLGRVGRLSDLTSDNLNRWVISMEETYKPKTRVHFRDAVLFVWRQAWERRDVPELPSRIRRIRIPDEVIRAWTIEEIRALLAATDILRGNVPMTHIRKRDWMPAFILTTYCVGFRQCDIRNHARWDHICESRILSLVMKKTKLAISRKLSDRVLDQLQLVRQQVQRGLALKDGYEPLIDPNLFEQYILPWPAYDRGFWDSFKRCVASAGIRPGGTKMLRRSAGSYVDRERPGMGGHFLGHRDSRIFDRSYNDRSISGQVPEPPPEI